MVSLQNERHFSRATSSRHQLVLEMTRLRCSRLRGCKTGPVTLSTFVRIHKTLRVTPAMAAGITDRLWSMEDIVAQIDARAPKPAPRGPYKKREAAISN